VRARAIARLGDRQPSQRDSCHEPITAQALRDVRAMMPTAPTIAPTRDEAALIADVMFAPPADLVADLGGMALLLGVRDNDLKGVDPLASLDLVQVHGNPTTQDDTAFAARTTTAPPAISPRSMRAARSSATRNRRARRARCVEHRRRARAHALDMYLSLRGKATPMLPLST